MEKEQPLIRISVRNLVEFIFRSGDIDNRIAAADKDAMLLGGKIHRKIQRRMGADYHAEVTLKYEVPCKEFILSVEGRADGIIDTPSGIVIDEIKGVLKDLDMIKEPVAVHLAQAKCYAYIYASQKKLEEIGVQMTYCNMETEEIKRFQNVYVYEELDRWFWELIGKYEKWARYQIRWKEKRNASIKEIEFPFAYREGQRDLTASVYRTILRKKKLFIQAPTGVGKTISTVFPAVKAVGEGLGEKIFYLTAKTITRTVAWQAFDILKEQALRMKVLVLTAKEKICFCEETNCNPEACPYAKGHYDRVNDAVYELLTTSDEMNREILEEQARKWKVCPHEMSLDVSEWVDAVICDYNYVFDPNVKLKRFFGEGVSGEYIFLIDEAHNLVERGREMYSASICKEEILEIRKRAGEKYPRFTKALNRVNRQLLEIKKDCEKYEILEGPGALPLSLLQVMGEMEKILEEGTDSQFIDEILDFYFSVRDFLNVSELVDENYQVYAENGEDGNFRVKLFCVNPAGNLGECLSKGNSSVFFSATFLPLGYYREMLSVRKDDFGIYVPSPFSVENRKILIGDDVSSRYTRRGYEEYRKVAEYIARTVWQKKGNYMVFFPSYRFMEEVYRIYEEEFSVGWIRTICQETEMSEKRREEFLDEFAEDGDAVVGFCVMGGVFSEGIDLIGSRLIGAVIVGTGLPQISNEREILKNYYDKKGEGGFDYAYRYPGMNKVLQAAGRVIRTQEDRGILLLLDERFWGSDYRGLFPAEWADRKRCRLENVERTLQQFWVSAKKVLT